MKHNALTGSVLSEDGSLGATCSRGVVLCRAEINTGFGFEVKMVYL